MPPRTHSSSSHSSHISSGSRSSSSGRSYSFPSRSYSSSSSRGSGPSGHSSSSHSSAPKYGSYAGSSRPSSNKPNTNSHNSNNRINRRPRVNQPVFMPAKMRPIIYYGRYHDYVYYDTPWEYEGKTYEAGYYDENGNRYDNLVMQDSSGNNTIILKCEYCGTVLKTEWTEGTIPSCPGCGAPMSTDNIQRDTITGSENYGSSGSSESGSDADKRSKRTGCLIAFLIFIALFIIFGSCNRSSSTQSSTYHESYEMPSETGNSGSTSAVTEYSNVDMYGETLYLKRSGSGSYIVTTEANADKALKWMDIYESYYDEETETFIWYNTNMSPALWQYWVEGVSSEYDSGWMEYEDGTWYIEEYEGGPWTVFGGDTSSFWHIGTD